MTALNCEARNTPCDPAPPYRSTLARLRRWLSAWKTPSRGGAVRDPWIGAIDAVAEMDAHMLKDIGAPAWLMAEVQHRQGRAAKRLVDLKIR